MYFSMERELQILDPITYIKMLFGRRSLHGQCGQEKQLQQSITVSVFIWASEYCCKSDWKKCEPVPNIATAGQHFLQSMALIWCLRNHPRIHMEWKAIEVFTRETIAEDLH